MKTKSVEEMSQAWCLIQPKEIRDNTELLFKLKNAWMAGFNKGEAIKSMVWLNSTDRYDKIIKTVCDYYKLNVDDIKTKTRKREIVQARQICMYFGHKKLSIGWLSLAKPFGKDHATAIHSFKTIKNLIDSDKNIKLDILVIEERLD